MAKELFCRHVLQYCGQVGGHLLLAHHDQLRRGELSWVSADHSVFIGAKAFGFHLQNPWLCRDASKIPPHSFDALPHVHHLHHSVICIIPIICIIHTSGTRGDIVRL